MTNQSVTRLSPLNDALQHAVHGSARWGELHGMPIVLDFGDSAAETAKAQTLALADASALPRVVIKGPSAAEFLRSQNVAIPAEILQFTSLPGSGFIGRTGGSEFFLEDGPESDTVARTETALGSSGQGVYRVLRQDASILLCGTRGAELLRQLSAYDFAAAPADRLTFTRVANLSCMALARRLNDIPVWQFWADGTYGLYLWETLLEVAHELGGDAIGLLPVFPSLS